MPLLLKMCSEYKACTVLLDINNGDRLVFAHLSPVTKLKIRNKNCSLHPLIGCPFGSVFQVDTGPQGPFLSHSVPSAQCIHPLSSQVLRPLYESSKVVAQKMTIVALCYIWQIALRKLVVKWYMAWAEASMMLSMDSMMMGGLY